ncbi:MAG: hypothetical protein ABI572_07560 [Actinomycetota bacterium]
MLDLDASVELGSPLEFASDEPASARIDAVLRLTLAIAWALVTVTVVTIMVLQGPLRGVVTLPARIVSGVGS